jgi:hypothetical protein
MKASIATTISSVIIVVSLAWLPPRTVISSRQKKRYKDKIREKTLHTMRHTDSSLQRMIRLRRNPTPVSPNVSSVQLKRKHCSPGLKTRKSQET